ncbi:MAG: hypothetical protein JXQ30_09455 [Spirochaetes bacterium]|nr:hypothetical protein [Spirochaetota bacterium]
MKREVLLVLLLLIIPVQPIAAQQIREIEFRDQKVTDILLAVGELAGKSIVPDETVTGRASYYFVETDFDTALHAFIAAYGLYVTEENGIYYVSRVHVEFDENTATVSIDADEVEIQALLRSLSEAIGRTILYDPLPAIPVTVHIKSVAPEKALSILLRKYHGYVIDSDTDFYYVKKVRRDTQAAGPPSKGDIRDAVSKTGDRYSVEADEILFGVVIKRLFEEAGLEYSLLTTKETILKNIRYNDKPFETLLRILLEQVQADYKRIDDVYYIFEVSKSDVLKRYKTVFRVRLQHLSAQELPQLLPPDFAKGRYYTIVPESNSVILNGSLAEIGPIQTLLEELDKPSDRGRYYRFDLNHLQTKNVKAFLPPEYKYAAPVTIPGTNSFVLRLSEDKRKYLDDYLSLIDIDQKAYPVRLKYIRAGDLKKHVPATLSGEEIIETHDPSLVFVKVSPQRMDTFFRELELRDRPVPQIRYTLLVVQYQDGEALSWNQNISDNMFEIRKPPQEGGGAFVGSIGKVFNLSFDIVSNFGYQFALQLNLDLSEERAKVLADTTLNGISGEEIQFQNTSTYRYREYEVDPNTGELILTGVVREITSGLIIVIRGWVSGDGLITMDVEATVSRRGADVAMDTAKPPTTFEKILKTHVCALSGRPVIIGGLITEENNITVQKIPVIGDIPLLGLLFRSQKETVDRSEFVIYIVPYAEYPESGDMNGGLKMEKLYHRFFRDLPDSYAYRN